MKAIAFGIIVLFMMQLFQSCQVYYNAKEQSAYIPNVVNQNLTQKKYDYSGVLCLGFNHAELQSNFRFADNWTAQNNFYVSKGFNLFELGTSYQTHLYKSLSFDISPGLSYGDMNYTRERKYVDGGKSPGYSYNIGYVKNEIINYTYYKAYCNTSLFLKLGDNIKLFIGARCSYSRFNGFNYYFKDITKKYSRPEEVNSEVSCRTNYIDMPGIEPHISLHVPCKKVGLFFQTVYYGQMGKTINANTYNVMDQADLPLLMSIGLTFNPNFAKK
jgi:hypothetical protein